MTNKLNKHTRKDPCPDCGVNTGSRHNRACPWAYTKQPDHKTRQKVTIKSKVSAIIKIVRS